MIPMSGHPGGPLYRQHYHWLRPQGVEGISVEGVSGVKQREVGSGV